MSCFPFAHELGLARRGDEPRLFDSSLGTNADRSFGARVTKPGTGRSAEGVAPFHGGLCPDQDKDRAAKDDELAAE